MLTYATREENAMSGDLLSAGKQRFSRDFWKFWAGQSISSFGSSVSGFALPLLVFKLTGSSVSLAFSMALTILPYLLFGLIIGAWVDRVQRKRLMLGTDLARALITASLFCAAQIGLLSIGWIFAVSFLNASLSIGFDAANFAAIPSLVSPEQLTAANGRAQAGYSTASVLGPLLAGLLIIVVPLPSAAFVCRVQRIRQYLALPANLTPASASR